MAESRLTVVLVVLLIVKLFNFNLVKREFNFKTDGAYSSRDRGILKAVTGNAIDVL